jgi:hypothetical protein
MVTINEKNSVDAGENGHLQNYISILITARKLSKSADCAEYTRRTPPVINKTP